MKIKLLITAAAILAAIMIIVGAYMPRNKAIRLEEHIDSAWSDINVQEKRRADLIPNLIDYILCCLTAYRGIIETGRDCNECAAAAACEYRPDPGKQVRLNCPHYVEPETKQNGSENPNTSPDHIAEDEKMEPFARGHEKDTVYRQDVINKVVTAVRKIILDPAPVDFKMSTDYAYSIIYDTVNGLPSARRESMTDEDIQTIRIHLSAFYESLCNQRRYREAKEYDELIARFLTFAQDRPEPVKWLKDEFGSRCGACGRYAYRDKFGKPWESDYCPICGAQMEVDADDT